jgi:hypothetical protein
MKMKKILSAIVPLLLLCSCGKEETGKIETFSTEAFAFDLGDAWEVNASTRVKGFSQTEENNKFSATIGYDIDLVTPEADTIKSIISKIEDKSDSEKLMEIPIEAQFELDSTYTEGDYKLIFNIKDANTGDSAAASVSFKLSNE